VDTPVGGVPGAIEDGRFRRAGPPLPSAVIGARRRDPPLAMGAQATPPTTRTPPITSAGWIGSPSISTAAAVPKIGTSIENGATVAAP